MRFRAAALLVVALGASVPLVLAQPAAAKSACWRALLNDWHDGRIDQVYAPACYSQALAHLPEDVRTYSSAEDDIRAALRKRLLTLSKAKASGSGRTLAQASATTTTGRRSPSGLVSGAIGQLGARDATSIPLAPLVLGGIAFLLLAANLARLLRRRRQGS